MNTKEVMAWLESKGTEQTVKTFRRHGCTVPMFGVKIGDMKTLVKKIKKDNELAKELFRTGNADAQYFAGMIANGADFTRTEIEEWLKLAAWSMVSEYTVPWMACEHPEAWATGLKWIEAKDEKTSSAGWNTLSGVVATREDADLDLKGVEKLLDRVVKTISTAPNRTRYTMNMFVISVGGYVKDLTKPAVAAARKMGKVEVDVGDTDCQIPTAEDYIKKMVARGYKKRKTMKC